MPTVLVIDDDAEFREAVTALLVDEGFEVRTASDGGEALVQLENKENPPPDLVLLDLLMPTVDGREFLARRRKRPDLARLPVIVMSADEKRRDVEWEGVVGVIPKQFDFAKLVWLVKKIVRTISGEGRALG
jgi:CheY-like chemotaxis protein